MRRLAILLLLVPLLAACGSAKKAAGTVLYAGGDWKVMLAGSKATAFHKVGGSWKPDTSGVVKIAILGPRPHTKVGTIPQFAVELRAPKPLVESGMWVDGQELVVKGGGAPTRGTIYGALGTPLAHGTHVAVAFARTDTYGSAVAWTFTV